MQGGPIYLEPIGGDGSSRLRGRTIKVGRLRTHLPRARVVAFELNQPSEKQPRDQFVISGRVVTRDSRVAAVEALTSDRVVGRGRCESLPARSFAGVVDSPTDQIARFGFVVPVHGEGEGEVLLQLLLETGEQIPVAGLRVKVTQPGIRSTPLRLGDQESPARASGDALTQDQVVWIFGAGRSGTTWLGSMLGAMPRFAMWDEPLVGALFGDFYRRYDGDRRGRGFILAPGLEETWLSGIRSMVLAGAQARFRGARGRVTS